MLRERESVVAGIAGWMDAHHVIVGKVDNRWTRPLELVDAGWLVLSLCEGERGVEKLFGC